MELEKERAAADVRGEQRSDLCTGGHPDARIHQGSKSRGHLWDCRPRLRPHYGSCASGEYSARSARCETVRLGRYRWDRASCHKIRARDVPMFSPRGFGIHELWLLVLIGVLRFGIYRRAECSDDTEYQEDFVSDDGSTRHDS